MSDKQAPQLRLKFDQRKRHRRDTGMLYEVMAALADGPQDLRGITEYFNAFLRRFGMFSQPMFMHQLDRKEWSDRLNAALESLAAKGWVVPEGDMFALTPAGRQELDSWLVEIRRAGELFNHVLQPKAVSVLTVATHLALAAIKLPVALLTGSVGLLNDGLDTLVDALSSILVFLGMQYDKEQYVNYALIALMLGVGALTLFESAGHILSPAEPEADLIAFAAVFVSAVASAALFVYQRYVGLKHGNLNLITQSVDSRNHIIVAGGVAVGLVAAVLHSGLLDALVGLGVSLLILRSGAGLLLDAIRSGDGEEGADLSKYRLPSGTYDRYRQGEMRDWMLYLVDSGRARTKDELFLEVRQGLDYSNNVILRELGLGGQPSADTIIELGYLDMLENGFVAGDGSLSLTARGREFLEGRMKRAARHTGHGYKARRKWL
jgi:hypothetical protein